MTNMTQVVETGMVWVGNAGAGRFFSVDTCAGASGDARFVKRIKL
jgi:hypothetical protein